MNTNKVVQGTYSDFKIVKSRNVAQVVIEIPLELANEFIGMFGVPRPDEEIWVAVAELNRRVLESRGEATKAVQQAGMLCRNAQFGKWLRDHRGCPETDPENHESIADGLRAILGIRSRTEFHNSPDLVTAFNRLKGEFDSWAIRLDGDA